MKCTVNSITKNKNKKIKTKDHGITKRTMVI